MKCTNVCIANVMGFNGARPKVYGLMDKLDVDNCCGRRRDDVMGPAYMDGTHQPHTQSSNTSGI